MFPGMRSEENSLKHVVKLNNGHNERLNEQVLSLSGCMTCGIHTRLAPPKQALT